MGLYLFTKRVHRWLVLIIMFLTIVMGGTGLLLKYPRVNTAYFSVLDPTLVRLVHSQLSAWFAAVLALMVVSGLVMYFFPVWQKHKQLRRQSAVNRGDR